VNTEPYGPVVLTAKGEGLARKAAERHAVVLEFLIALGVSESTARVDSEGIEHHVSAETLAAMRAFVRKHGKG
jgi:DtxR family manganese transport transcriptional regulator